jgi:peptide alpha-N-acetyltransferase
MSPSQPLPPKENALFKKILRCYEHKQYKNGLKFAKQILSNAKFAEHGETLAMKGLTLNCLGRKEEAYDFVRRGLRNDLQSHVCWHVFGLLQRSDHKYVEAIKSYRNALKWDKDNIQILRDLSLLQIQMRDLEGYRDTRYQLFSLRPTQRASWIGFAMAYHLLKDYEMAAKILEEFRKTSHSSQQQKAMHNSSSGGNNNGNNSGQTSRMSNEYYEQSELLLYQVMVLKEAANFHEAITYLDKNESEICDKLAFYEFKSELLINIGKFKEAKKVIKEQLIGRNHENANYYYLLERALDLNADKENERLKLYLDFQRIYPRSQMPFRLPLNFVTNLNLFKDMIDIYLRKSLRKGQPALFRDMKLIYNKEFAGNTFLTTINNKSLPQKIEILQNLMLSYVQNLIQFDSFDSTESSWGSEATTCLLWVYYYLAQHFDYLKDFTSALKYVNIALEHTPTLIELFVIKAKIYKHAGNIDEAVKCVDEAQSLDTADRYLNSKCAKYLLRANKVTEAEEMCSKFTREGVSASENLNEMQCMWFQTEAAIAFQRQEKWGEALKKCIEIDRHFAEINEDQFDFHTYCMRKMTLRSYIELLRLEDVLKSHSFYFKAAKIAIQVYLRLYDKPLGENEELEDKNISNMSASELKKLRNKQRKAKLRATAAEKTETQTQNTANDKNNENTGSELHQEKLDSYKLERPEKPLDEAIKFLTPLQILAKERIDTHLLAFEIYFRKGKIMLMLQSLKRAIRLDSSNAYLQKQLVLFFNFVEAQKEQLNEAINKVLEIEMIKLIANEKVSSAFELNQRFLQRNSNSFLHRIESSKLMHILANGDNNKLSSKPNEIDVIIENLENLNGVDIDSCTQLLKSLRSGDFGAIDENAIEQFKKKCHLLFPFATQFMSEEECQLMNNHNDVINHNNYSEALDNSEQIED